MLSHEYRSINNILMKVKKKIKLISFYREIIPDEFYFSAFFFHFYPNELVMIQILNNYYNLTKEGGINICAKMFY